MATKGDPKLVEDTFEDHYSVPTVGAGVVRTDYVRIYEWVCDDTGSETTHEGTYATGGFRLAGGGRYIPRDKTRGIWREVYRKIGTWGPV